MRPLDLLELGGARRTPFIPQSEAAECGLACLAMVAGYHGFRTDLAALRRRFSVSMKGATLKALMQTAEQIGFSPRALRVETDALSRIPLPAVLHWNFTHFVVLTRVSRSFRGTRYHIHDPARGPRIMDLAELSPQYTGVALELIRSESFRPQSDRSPLRIGQLWSRISGLWSSLRTVLLLSIVLQLAALAAPFYLQLAIDTVLPAADADLLVMLALGFCGLALITMLTGWLRSLLLVGVGSSLSYQVTVNLYRHLLRLPLPWFEKRHVGDVMSRFQSTRPITELLSRGLVASAIDGIMAFATLALMFVYSPMLALVAVAAWLLYTALKIGFFRSLRMLNADVITRSARESSAFIESVRGIAAIKAFGQEGNRQQSWQQLKADTVNAEIRLGEATAGFDAGGQLILALERLLFVYLAVRLAMEGAFTIGMIFAFQAYKQQFLDAATRLVEQALRYRLLDIHLARISDIALSRPEVPAENFFEPVEPVRGEIELRAAGFRYGSGEAEIVRDVNLKVDPGEAIALVGPSGGGKTTLMKMMMGLLEPTAGNLLVDGKPLGAPALGAWRRRIGSVSQDDVLYAGTLAENIAFFDPEIDMARVVEVAKLAAIHDDIEKMPMRYESLVGDMGSALSGGQRQRVLLARALYPRPSVLFIDEGTAHLDAATERQVMAMIAGLGITRIVSAHRPAALAGASRVYAVEGGRVVRVERTPREDAQRLPAGPGGEE